MKKILLVVSFSFLLQIIYAQCPSDADSYTRKFANKFVTEEFDGGASINSYVYECSYNSYLEEWTLDVLISFRGNIIRDNFYQVRGIISINKGGSSFEITNMNERADDYLSMKGLFKTSVIVYGLYKEYNKK